MPPVAMKKPAPVVATKPTATAAPAVAAAPPPAGDDGLGPPPILKLLRQVSVEAKAGVISSEQKSKIKDTILSRFYPPTSGGAAAALAADAANDSKKPAVVAAIENAVADAKSSSAGAAATAADSGDEKLSVLSPAAVPLLPLLRQLSAAAREGMIDKQTKTQLKEMLLAARAEQIQAVSAAVKARARTTFFQLGGAGGFVAHTHVGMTPFSDHTYETTTSSDILRMIYGYLDGETLLACSGVNRLWIRAYFSIPAVNTTFARHYQRNEIQSNPNLTRRWRTIDHIRMLSDNYYLQKSVRLDSERGASANTGTVYTEPIPFRELPERVVPINTQTLMMRVYSHDAIGNDVSLALIDSHTPASISIYRLQNMEPAPRLTQKVRFFVNNLTSAPSSNALFSACHLSRLVLAPIDSRRVGVWPFDPRESYVPCDSNAPIATLRVPRNATVQYMQLITLTQPPEFDRPLPPAPVAADTKTSDRKDFKSDSKSAATAAAAAVETSFPAATSQAPPQCLACIGLTSGEVFVFNAFTGKIRHHLFGPPPEVLAQAEAEAKLEAAASALASARKVDGKDEPAPGSVTVTVAVDDAKSVAAAAAAANDPLSTDAPAPPPVVVDAKSEPAAVAAAAAAAPVEAASSGLPPTAASVAAAPPVVAAAAAVVDAPESAAINKWRIAQPGKAYYDFHFGSSPFLQTSEYYFPSSLMPFASVRRSGAAPGAAGKPFSGAAAAPPHFAVRSRTTGSRLRLDEAEPSSCALMDVVNGKVSKPFEPHARAQVTSLLIWHTQTPYNEPRGDPGIFRNVAKEWKTRIAGVEAQLRTQRKRKRVLQLRAALDSLQAQLKAFEADAAAAVAPPKKPSADVYVVTAHRNASIQITDLAGKTSELHSPEPLRVRTSRVMQLCPESGLLAVETDDHWLVYDIACGGRTIRDASSVPAVIGSLNQPKMPYILFASNALGVDIMSPLQFSVHIDRHKIVYFEKIHFPIHNQYGITGHTPPVPALVWHQHMTTAAKDYKWMNERAAKFGEIRNVAVHGRVVAIAYRNGAVRCFNLSARRERFSTSYTGPALRRPPFARKDLVVQYGPNKEVMNAGFVHAFEGEYMSVLRLFVGPTNGNGSNLTRVNDLVGKHNQHPGDYYLLFMGDLETKWAKLTPYEKQLLFHSRIWVPINDVSWTRAPGPNRFKSGDNIILKEPGGGASSGVIVVRRTFGFLVFVQHPTTSFSMWFPSNTPIASKVTTPA